MPVSERLTIFAFRLVGLLLALGFAALLLMAVGAPPLEAFRQLMLGSVGSGRKIAEVISVSLPLLLVTAGLLITFTAGLWNIGIEGQIAFGAIFTTWLLRAMLESSAPPALSIGLAILLGAVGGAVWALLAGVLKVYGGVSEIFGGLGLNFVATAATIYLIFGPWRRPGIGSMSGTEPFPDAFALPELAGLRLSLWSVGLALAGLIAVYILLERTQAGLRFKAVGRSPRAAYVLGIPTARYTLLAFALCGALAGLAGAIQVVGVYHRLIPSISSGYGFLGLLIAMLINSQIAWLLPVALFYAALVIGSIQLPIVLRLESSLAGVLQGAFVLFVILMEGVRLRLSGRKAPLTRLEPPPQAQEAAGAD